MGRIISVLLILLIVSSCTIQKRLHRPGWHVSWNKNYKSDSKFKEVDFAESDEKVRNEEEIITSSNETEEVQKIEIVEVSEEVQVAEVETNDINTTSTETDGTIPEESDPDPKANSTLKKETNSDTDEPKRSRSFPASIILLFLAVIGLIGAAVMWMGAGNNPSPTGVLITIFGAIIIGFISLVLLLVGVALLSKPKKTKIKKEKSTDPEIRKKQDKTNNLSVYVILGIIVFFIGLLMFYLYT